MVLDSQENIIVGGSSYSNILFGNQLNGSSDFFVSKHSSNFSWIWTYYDGLTNFYFNSIIKL